MPAAGDRAQGPALLSVLDTFRLDERVGLVTGAARGLGRAIATALAEAGADVALLDVLDLRASAAEVEDRGRHCHRVTLDLRSLDPARATEVVDEVVGALGGLDILVNNAGIIRRAEAAIHPQDDWKDVIATNLSSAFYLSQALARHLIAAGRRGSIVNTASLLSFQGGVLVPGYAAAKSGLAGLTRALANEWARHGINVNAIAPGYMATELSAGVRSDAARAGEMLARIPAGRWGEASEIQGAAVFLASEASSYVHGAVVPVDGGWLAR